MSVKIYEKATASNKKKYIKYLKGKRVALVGPSWHTKGTNQRELLHSYDVIVRMNAGYKYNKKLIPDMGTRTDVFYCSMSEYFFRNSTFKHLLKYQPDIKWIVGTGHHNQNILKVLNNKMFKHIGVLNADKKLFKSVSKKLAKKVTSGIMTISDLLTYDIKELYITGITFYNKKFIPGRKKYYYSNYIEKLNGRQPIVCHDNKGEFKIFKNMCHKDKRIKCDEMLSKIVENC